MRLDKFISDSTSHSRREVRKLLRSHAVEVDGAEAKKPDERVEISSDVRVNGEKIHYREFIYLMLNKPEGWLSATEDDRDPVVTGLVPEEFRHYGVFPAGRLDKDAEGLLLLTNDGQFGHSMTSPKKNVRKRYSVLLDKPAEERDVELFRAGMVFREFTAKPALLELTENPCEVFVEISEGKFHQVKRMCERAGKTVLRLKRVAIGGLKLDETLKPGEVKLLSEEDLAKIAQ